MWKLKARIDTHTHARTHKQGSSWDNIFSPEMTEYNKNRLSLLAMDVNMDDPRT